MILLWCVISCFMLTYVNGLVINIIMRVTFGILIDIYFKNDDQKIHDKDNTTIKQKWLRRKS